jgi:hypothetical protein
MQTPVVEGKVWEATTREEKVAIRQLGWTRETWDAGDERPFNRSWASLGRDGMEHHARRLGWTKEQKRFRETAAGGRDSGELSSEYDRARPGWEGPAVGRSPSPSEPEPEPERMGAPHSNPHGDNAPHELNLSMDAWLNQENEKEDVPVEGAHTDPNPKYRV